jgi:hypothetical protein
VKPFAGKQIDPRSPVGSVIQIVFRAIVDVLTVMQLAVGYLLYTQCTSYYHDGALTLYVNLIV